jgi:hypothetical protein
LRFFFTAKANEKRIFTIWAIHNNQRYTVQINRKRAVFLTVFLLAWCVQLLFIFVLPHSGPPNAIEALVWFPIIAVTVALGGAHTAGVVVYSAAAGVTALAYAGIVVGISVVAKRAELTICAVSNSYAGVRRSHP